MTKGILLLMLVSMVVVGIVIGVLSYLREFAKLKKTTNLSDFGIRERLDVVEHIFCGIFVALGIGLIMVLISGIIDNWNVPI